MTARLDQKGFTLLEVVAAIAVFAFGMLALFRLQGATAMSNSLSSEITQASVLAENRIETLMGWPYSDPGGGGNWLRDVNGDGTGKDGNGDGFDDGGNNFGLTKTGANADGCITVNIQNNVVSDCTAALVKGRDYRISHNVAVDQPLINNKTISVIVNWLDAKDLSHTVTLTSIKSGNY